MGTLISLDAHRRVPVRADARSAETRPAPVVGAPVTFSFDLALPQTYLAAERVERSFADVVWQPAYATAVWEGRVPFEQLAGEAEERARALGEPLIWPEPCPSEVRPAMRAAALACELGLGARFVLAAGRLAFCGGFNLGDPEVLAEAAAAAGVPLETCLNAAGDIRRDASIDAAGRRLREMGATALPALQVGHRMFGGEARLPEAMAASRLPA